MRLCGIDLAAEPRNTGVATILVQGRTLVVEALQVGSTDDQIVHAVQQAHRTGVDVPLGWPKAFAKFIDDHAHRRLVAPEDTAAVWRRGLAMRITDFHVQATTGLTPLSVAANLIAYPAFRWAGVEARLRDAGIDVVRDGSGAVAEVYPAAALYRWHLPHRGYKGVQQRSQRQDLMRGLTTKFAGLRWNGFDEIAASNDNAFDAVVAALMSYQIQTGQAQGPPDAHRDVARIEGWIWLPKTPEC